MDRAVKRGVREMWLGRVSGFFAKEIVATYMAASSGFGKVVGVNVEVQDHVNGAILDGGVWVGRSIIEEPNGCITGCLHCFRLLGSNGDDGNDSGRVDSDGVV